MALTDCAKWELPLTHHKLGQITIHITRSEKATGGGVQAIGTTNCRFDTRVGNPGTLIAPFSLSEAKTDEDGFIVADAITLELSDAYRVTGREFTGTDFAGGSDFDTDTYSTGSTVLETLFADPADIFVAEIFATDSVDSELIFKGDIDPAQITWTHLEIESEHTAQEYRTGTVSITINAIVERARKFTMQELLDHIVFTTGDNSHGDMTTDPAYAGVTAGFGLATSVHNGEIQDADFPAYTQATLTTIIEGLSGVSTDGPKEKWAIQVASAARYTAPATLAEETWTAKTGIWFISLLTLIEQVAELCGFSFDRDNDIEFPFEFDESQWATDHFEYVAADLADVCICLNALFGFSPIDGADWDTPITIPRDAGVIELLKYFTRYGMYFVCTYDTGTNDPVLKLRSVDTQGAAMPSDLILDEGSQELESTQGANDYVRCETMGADGAVIVPSGRSGAAVDWSVPWRIRATANTIFHNRNLPWWEQYKCYKIASDDDATVINPDCWYFMSLLYVYESSNTPNSRYPAAYESGAHWPFLEGGTRKYRGYYALSRIRHVASGYSRSTTDVMVAQLMARELVGNRVNLTRTYLGVNRGNIAALKPGITTDFLKHGTVRAMEAVRVSPSTDGTVVIEWREIPADEEIPQPWRAEGSQNTSSAGGETSGTGNGGTIVTAPGGIFVSDYEYDYTDPDAPDYVGRIRGLTRDIRFRSTANTLIFTLGVEGSAILLDVDTNGFPVVTVDVTSLNEPTGNSPPSGAVTVDGISLGAGGEGYKSVFIRSGTYEGIWLAPNTSGDWISFAPQTNVIDAGAIIRVASGKNSGGSAWQQEPNTDWSANPYTKFPTEAVICVESDFASAGTVAIPNGATIPVPLSSASGTVAGGFNSLLGIDLSTADPDTLQTRVQGVYDVWCEVYIVTPGGWAASDIEMTITDETGAPLGTWPQVARIKTAAGVQTLVFGGGRPVDLDRFDASGGTLPLGVQFHLSCSVAAQPSVSLDYWRVSGGLVYRGELEG